MSVAFSRVENLLESASRAFGPSQLMPWNSLPPMEAAASGAYARTPPPPTFAARSAGYIIKRRLLGLFTLVGRRKPLAPAAAQETNSLGFKDTEPNTTTALSKTTVSLSAKTATYIELPIIPEPQPSTAVRKELQKLCALPGGLELAVLVVVARIEEQVADQDALDT